ncbi:ARS binding protein 2-domain-containing protein [Xylariaceae sp. FL0804]|nr:ARS binding protein 2-domain-containing protein [Xylariaceae sp. FL0804]
MIYYDKMALAPHIATHHLTPPSSCDNTSPRAVGVRPTLPPRDVTSETIEGAYVDFILYCNPAVSLEVNTTALRDAFRVPPKSEGKSFSSFTLFELIAKLHQKELKTWAELALRLGVEPPDQGKGQSSQKIQQYAVRLKRWMHSMHVDAFFDYLLDIRSPYWTEIPPDQNPVCEEGRDGVAAEDDMALRALLPHIRPRRGRKRPEDDHFGDAHSQRPRLISPGFNGDQPWTAQPDTRPAFIFPLNDPRSAVQPGSESAYPWHGDIASDPLSAYPQSTVTPTTGRAFWPDTAEPRSAITPKSRFLNRRHGAKAVSSAWRSSMLSATGKTRGRPPLSRLVECSPSALPENREVFPSEPLGHPPQPTSAPIQMYSSPSQLAPAESEPLPVSIEQTCAPAQRPPRPGGLSLQVPERAGGPVRLATPPTPVVMAPTPVVLVNGKWTTNDTVVPPGPNGMPNYMGKPDEPANDAFTLFDRNYEMFTTPDNPLPENKIDVDGPDKTNFYEVQSIFVATFLESDWLNAKGEPDARGSIEEVTAIIQSVIRSLSEQALTREAFLINLSALAGGTFLLKDGRTIQRLEVAHDHTKYLCTWTLAYGSGCGAFTLTETVPHYRWRRDFQEPGKLPDPGDIPADGDAAADYWRNQYEKLSALTNKKIKNLAEIRSHVTELMRLVGEGQYLYHGDS